MNNKLTLHVSFVFVLLMGLFNFANTLNLWMPYWGILFILIWEYLETEKSKLPTVFLLGILTDLCSAGVLGAHALSYVLISMLFKQILSRFNFYTVWQQAGLVALFGLVHAGLLYGIQTLLVQPPLSWPQLGGVLTTSLVWLLIGGWVQNKSGYFTNISKIES